jgi:hypothetical protein
MSATGERLPSGSWFDRLMIPTFAAMAAVPASMLNVAAPMAVTSLRRFTEPPCAGKTTGAFMHPCLCTVRTLAPRSPGRRPKIR